MTTLTGHQVRQAVEAPGPYFDKCIVLLSGGLDSTAALAYCVGANYNPVAVSFRYGSKHEDLEINAAIAVAEYFNVDHHIIDLPEDIFERSNSSLLKHSDREVPKEAYPAEGEPSTVVPFRNGIFLSIATAIAVQVGAHSIFIATHLLDWEADDDGVVPYRDCHPLFLQHFGQAMKRGAGVALYAPFAQVTKAEIISMTDVMGPPWELTWSCYDPHYFNTVHPVDHVEAMHCGQCATCRDRKQAFNEAGFDDPTEYYK